MVNSTLSKSVLVVDDSSAMVNYLKSALEGEGHSIITAPDGLKGLQMLTQHRPLAMICDLHMPGMDGLKLLQLRSAQPELREIPIIILTAEHEPETKVRVLDAGAADYVTKPFHAKELAARVRVHLRVQSLTLQLHEANERLQALATTDGLTGLFNRRRFDQQLSEEMSRAIRYEVPISLLLLDIDHFKRLNDTHGHQLGDEVLRMVGATLRGSLRQTDFAARYGGEEFAVILPHTPLVGGRQTAERLRSAVADLALPLERETVRVTVSIGLSCVTGEGARADELIRQADHALYEAKRAGRDRALTYSPKKA